MVDEDLETDDGIVHLMADVANGLDDMNVYDLDRRLCSSFEPFFSESQPGTYCVIKSLTKRNNDGKIPFFMLHVSDKR